MSYNIPDSFDQEWQCLMLRKLAKLLDSLDEKVVDGGYVQLDEAVSVVEALREYGGY